MGFFDLWRKLFPPDSAAVPTASLDCSPVLSKEVSRNLTPRAHRVVEHAKGIAAKGGHSSPNHGQLAVALIGLQEGCAASVLKRLEVDERILRSAIQDATCSPTMEEILALSEMERMEMNHRYLGTEHILLGLVRHGENTFAYQLAVEGLNLNVLREELLRELDPNISFGTPPSEPV